MKRLETEYLPYEWMKKDLGLAGAELVLFSAICENRFGLLDGPADYAAVAKKLGMSKSTYYLSRKLLLKRGLIRLVKRPGGSLIRLTDKSLVLAEKDPRLASLYVKNPFPAAATDVPAKLRSDGVLNDETVAAVLSSFADILEAANSGVSSILASLRAIEKGGRKADKKTAQKTEKAEQLGLFD